MRNHDNHISYIQLWIDSLTTSLIDRSLLKSPVSEDRVVCLTYVIEILLDCISYFNLFYNSSCSQYIFIRKLV